MVTVTNIRNIDYVAIVRSLKNPGKMKRVPVLSPSI